MPSLYGTHLRTTESPLGHYWWPSNSTKSCVRTLAQADSTIPETRSVSQYLNGFAREQSCPTCIHLLVAAGVRMTLTSCTSLLTSIRRQLYEQHKQHQRESDNLDVTDPEPHCHRTIPLEYPLFVKHTTRARDEHVFFHRRITAARALFTKISSH